MYVIYDRNLGLYMKRELLNLLDNFTNLFTFAFNYSSGKDEIIKDIDVIKPHKTVEELNIESFNNSWFQVGENLRKSYDNVAKRYGYEYKK